MFLPLFGSLPYRPIPIARPTSSGSILLLAIFRRWPRGEAYSLTGCTVPRRLRRFFLNFFRQLCLLILRSTDNKQIYEIFKLPHRPIGCLLGCAVSCSTCTVLYSIVLWFDSHSPFTAQYGTAGTFKASRRICPNFEY